MATADLLIKNEGVFNYGNYVDLTTTNGIISKSPEEMSKQRMARMGSWIVRDDVRIKQNLGDYELTNFGAPDRCYSCIFII